MDQIDLLVSKINKEQSGIGRKDAAKVACEYTIDYIRSNKRELKDLAEQLVQYCERYNKFKSAPIFKFKINTIQSPAVRPGVSKDEPAETEFQYKEAKDFMGESVVIGLDGIRNTLRDSIELPLEHPELFTGLRKPQKNILLYGPPGTGKTHIVQSIITNTKIKDLKLINITASDLMSKYQGNSEKQIRKLFETAVNLAPVIIFIDEIDFLCRNRSEGFDNSESSNRIKSELLVRISEIEKVEGVFLIGATNFPWSIDSAFIRRFHKRIYIGLPTQIERINMFQHLLQKNKNDFNENDFDEMARKTEGWSMSDIKILGERILCQVISNLQNEKCFIEMNGYWSVCKSCKNSIETDELGHGTKFNQISGKFEEPTVSIGNFREVVKLCKSSVVSDQLKKYEMWTEKFGEKC